MHCCRISKIVCYFQPPIYFSSVKIESGNRKKQPLRVRLTRFFGSKVFLHSTFWVLLYLFNIFMDDMRFGLWFSLIENFFDIIFYIFIVYLNLQLLIPRYLHEQSFLLYSVALIITAVLIAPVNALVIYLVNFQHPQDQIFISSNLQIYFLSSFFIAGASTIFKITGDWLKQQREQMKLKQDSLVSELKFLRSQINPHFLFNTLNNIYSLALIKSDKTPEIILKLSEILRYMLYECNAPKVPLEKEISYIKNYLDLEKLRLGDDARIEFTVEGPFEQVEISPFLFSPFLENAVKHGVNSVIEKAWIEVNLKIEQEKLFFIVKNNKTDEELRKLPGGIGLVNVERRLKLLYPDNYDLRIENNLSCYKIELQLNHNTN